MKRTLPLLFLLFFEGFVGCGGECNEGCDNFRPSETCRSACNLTTATQLAANSRTEETLSCLNGCKMAADRFAQRIEEEAILRNPRIIPESITDTSMNLLWRNQIHDPLLGGTFYLQSDRENRQHWKNVQRINVDLGAGIEHVLRVDNLVPYERYRFRVAWRLPEAEVHSPPSKAARTRADEFGRPSRPILDGVRQERGLRVNVAWRPPMQPKGPLAFYRLSIRGLSTDLMAKTEVRTQPLNGIKKGCMIPAKHRHTTT